MAKKVVKKAVGKAKSGNLWAILGSLLGIVGFIIVYIAKKEDKYAMFYAKQSAVLNVLVIVIAMIPIIGWIIGAFSSLAFLWLAYKAYVGEQYRFPVVADLADQLKI